ncbi:MAG: hypothetical protein IJ627_02015 [Bacteroidales bacterium]|nr:hypothetical protein [Bacteroidales bacterium]
MAYWYDIFSPLSKEIIKDDERLNRTNRVIAVIVFLVTVVILVLTFVSDSASLTDGINYPFHVFFVSLAKVALYLIGYVAVCWAVRTIAHILTPKGAPVQVQEETAIRPLEKLLVPSEKSIKDVIIDKSMVFLNDYHDGKAVACLFEALQERHFIEGDNQTAFFNAAKATFPDSITINLRAFQMAYSTLSEDLFEGKAMKTVDKMRDVLDELLNQIPAE